MIHTKKGKITLAGLLLFLLVAVFLSGRLFFREGVKLSGGNEEAASSEEHSHEPGEEDHDETDFSGMEGEAAHDETEHTHGDEGSDEEGAAPIHLSREAVKNIGLQSEPAIVRTIEEVMTFPGEISPLPDQEAFVTTRILGKVERVYVNLGETVQKGDRLAEIRSLEFENLQAELFQEMSNLKLVHINHERIKNLVEKKIVASKELARMEADHKKAETVVDGLKRKLLLLGLNKSDLKTLVKKKRFIPVISVTAPLSGQIVERDITIGGTVDPQHKMFHIINLSNVLVEGDIPEDHGNLITKGQAVRVRVSTYPGETFVGQIDYISDVVNPKKRTIHLWSVLNNQTRRLKPGMFARVTVITKEVSEAVAVPIHVVLEQGVERFVFVQNGETFSRKSVILGIRDDRFVEVLEGIMPGDRVVVKGNQQLLLAKVGSGAIEDEHGSHTH